MMTKPPPLLIDDGHARQPPDDVRHAKRSVDLIMLILWLIASALLMLAFIIHMLGG